MVVMVVMEGMVEMDQKVEMEEEVATEQQEINTIQQEEVEMVETAVVPRLFLYNLYFVCF